MKDSYPDRDYNFCGPFSTTDEGRREERTSQLDSKRQEVIQIVAGLNGVIKVYDSGCQQRDDKCMLCSALAVPLCVQISDILELDE